MKQYFKTFLHLRYSASSIKLQAVGAFVYLPVLQECQLASPRFQCHNLTSPRFQCQPHLLLPLTPGNIGFFLYLRLTSKTVSHWHSDWTSLTFIYCSTAHSQSIGTWYEYRGASSFSNGMCQFCSVACITVSYLLIGCKGK